MSCGVSLQSESLKQLLIEYIRDNIQKSEFPRDIKLNLTRIIENVNIDKNDVKESILSSVCANDITLAKNIYW